ncbi:MAG: hypothetical protein U0903_08440 [Planctomycetales bacterium]
MMTCSSIRVWMLTAFVGAAIASAGCHMVKGPVQPLGWTFNEQSKEIEKLAPIGTPRAEVERRLRAAGIMVAPGKTQALAYCDQWNRSGASLPMNVALQFDAEGKLIGMRPAQAETAVLSNDSLALGPVPAGASSSSYAPAGKDEEGSKDRRRTPFQDAPARSR